MRPITALLMPFLIMAILIGSADASGQAENYFREAFVAATAREWDKAITYYTKSIELDPNNPESYFQRAVTYEMTGADTQAAADYEKALSLKPDYYLAMEYLAKLYERHGAHEKALDLYTKALPLVKDAKWRSIVKWWIASARKNLKAERRDEKRGSRPSDSSGARR